MQTTCTSLEQGGMNYKWVRTGFYLFGSQTSLEQIEKGQASSTNDTE
jgi:hypothetical protein